MSYHRLNTAEDRGGREGFDDLPEKEASIDHLSRPFEQDLFRTRRLSPKSRLNGAYGVLRIVLEILICCLLVANLVYLHNQSSAERQARDRPTPDHASSEESVFHGSRFGKDVDYMSLDHKYDGLWSEDASAKKGLVRVNSLDEEKAAWGGIAMFHQLHCLAGFRKALQRARRGEDIGIDHHDDLHWPHCFYYMRQAILCYADDTIEMPNRWISEYHANGTVTARRGGSIDGVDDTRSCRDSTHLYQLRAERGLVAELTRQEMVKNGTLGKSA